MKLYRSAASPYVRKVSVVIREAGLTGIDEIAAMGTPVDPGSMPVDQNPLGKIPALVTDEGLVLYDSRVICRYLDSRAGAGLYPEAPRLWDTLVVEATADGILDAAVLIVYEARTRPEDLRFSPWVEGQWAKIARALAALETRWMAHLQGPLDMGQIAVGCALGYLEFRHGARDWRKGHPRLAEWEAGFAQRPAMQATLPQG
ncbi:glutathione S-transferase [Xinfangfangia pollutisoli]|uniref:glutathione S-transferase n=1 Tax=Xinfangfangia pollutisoli TaxID=2865960 RepID=UPI001CD42E14|nr:glutathione S-transferase [Xinfangfangia pollutisoli]